MNLMIVKRLTALPLRSVSHRSLSDMKRFQDAVKSLNDRKWSAMNKMKGGEESSAEIEECSDGLEVTSDEELQAQWKAMESRVVHRKSRMKGDGGPQGRGKRNKSAWDHEVV